MKTLILFAGLLSLVTACNGKKSGGNTPDAIKEPVKPDVTKPVDPIIPTPTPTPTPVQPDIDFSVSFEKEKHGVYTAKLIPLNKRVVGETMEGTFTLTKKEDEVIAHIDMKGSPGGITHAQRIYNGTSCPTEASDKNADGFIDMVEGAAAYGDILIPLDGDLDNQESQFAWDPLADQYGRYVYTRTGSFRKMLYDLKRRDTFPNDNVMKLKANEKFEVVGKVVVIHGVHENANLPRSVATRNGISNFETLPIACGVITKITDGTEVVTEEAVNVEELGAETVGGSNGSSDETLSGFHDTSIGISTL